ncbi:MAG: phosphatase PAP2 family protein [Bacteroidales bacterium]
MLELLADTDTTLFLFLNGFHSPFWDDVMWFVSGKMQWIPLYLAIISWMIYKFRWKAVYIIISVIILIALTDQLAVKLFKETVLRLRPCHQPELSRLVHLVNNHCGGKYGFISNHAANSFALATFTAFIFRNRIFTMFIFFWAAVVAYSRVYLGVHFPGDIIAGAMFGMLVAVLVFIALKTINNRFKLGLSG